MSSTQLFIPSKIKVGYQERDDTYTGQLAYVTYYDNKGVLRKEKSWQSWRNEKIEPCEFNNEPTEGFVLNKKVGGYDTGWNHRQTYSRVYDPRGFEFEITIPNLLYILGECDCMKGKGLSGTFVYAWEGTELVLLPTCSPNYKNSKEYTNLQHQKIKAKNLVPGHTYMTRKQQKLVYMGKFENHHNIRRYWANDKTTDKKKFLFYDLDGKFHIFNNINTLAILASDVADLNYAEKVAEYCASPEASKLKRIFTKKDESLNNKFWCYEKHGKYYYFAKTKMILSSVYNRQTHQYEYTYGKEYIKPQTVYAIDSYNHLKSYYDFDIKEFPRDRWSYRTSYYEGYKTEYNNLKPNELKHTFTHSEFVNNGQQLYAELENGNIFLVTPDHKLIKEGTQNEENNNDE